MKSLSLRPRMVGALVLCGALVGASAVAHAQHEAHSNGDHAAQTEHGEGHDHGEGGHGEGHGEGGHAEGGHAEGGHGEHGHHGPDSINWSTFGGTHTNTAGQTVKNPPPFISTVINFALLAIILFMAVKRVINPGLASRRAAVEAEIAEAQKLREEAVAMHKEYTDRLAKLDDELTKLRDEIRSAGETESKRIIAEAEARAERMVKEGELTMAQEVRSVRDGLRRDAVESAVRGAEEAVRKAVGAQDQTRLAEEFLGDLEKQALGGREGAQA